MTAAAYIRRSVTGKNNQGDISRETQEAAVRRLCGADVALYVDWGVSGRKADRPEYQRLRADIAAGLVTSVCAYNLSRLGRKVSELWSFVDLCRDHNVPIRTATDNIDTGSAMGRMLFTIMAAVSAFTAELAAEAQITGSAERFRLHKQEDLLVPNSKGVMALPSATAPYGTRYITREKDGHRLTYSEPDPDKDLSVLVDAYTSAGSVRGAAVVLNRDGIAAPRGGQWNRTSLQRVLDRLADEGLVTLPERNAGRRSPTRPRALFAGLLRCHCGRRMTANVARGQYYCSSARSHADHGRMSVGVRTLETILRPEADEFDRQLLLESVTEAKDTAAKEGVIERRMAALDARLDVGRIPAEVYKAAVAGLMGELADLRRDLVIDKRLRMEPVPEWTDTAAMNAHLRRIWTHVQLDPSMVPVVYWRVGRKFDPVHDEAIATDLSS